MNNFNNKNNPIKQHTIPYVYLKLFENKNNLLYTYDIKNKEFREQSAKKSTIMKDFYTFIDESGIKKYDIEKFLGTEIEKKYLQIIEKLEKKNNLIDVELSELSRFLIFIWVRTPKLRNELNNMLDFSIKELTQMLILDENFKVNFMKKIDQSEKDVNEFLDQIREGSYDIQINKEWHLSFIISSFEEMAKILLMQKWYFLIPPEDTYFLTSDAPFSMKKIKGGSNFSGYSLLNTEKTIPLNPNLCLFIGKLGEEIGFIKINKKMVRNINLRTICSANHYVFSNDKFLLEGMIKKAKK